MPTWKTFDDVEWTTQPLENTNASLEKDVVVEEVVLVYEKNLKLAIINSLSEHNRPSQQKQSKIDFHDNDGGKVKYRLPTGLTQQPTCADNQPPALRRNEKKRKAEVENKKMAASMDSFLNKKKPNVKKEVDLVATGKQNEVTPPTQPRRPTVDLYHNNDVDKALQIVTTDDDQTSNVGSEGANKQLGDTFSGFEGMVKVCAIRNTPAGSEIWLNPEAIREFIAHFEHP